MLRDNHMRGSVPPPHGYGQPPVCQSPSDRYEFVAQPMQADYRTLAGHVADAAPGTLHSSLWPQRERVAQSLRRMADEPAREAHCAAYQALRLLVW